MASLRERAVDSQPERYRLLLPVGSIGPMRGRGLDLLRRNFGAADAA